MWILSIVILILILGIIILVHEFGHFIWAKMFHVHIYEFSIGMGPKVLTRKGKDGIDYNLRAIPIGGFVAMAGEVYEDDDTKKIPKEKFMCNRPWYQRLVILIAGVFNNFLLAIIILIVLGLVWGSPSLEPRVGKVIEGYPAEAAGMKDNDLILSVNGSKVITWDKAQLLFLLKDKDNKYEIEVKHDNGKKELLVITPKVEKDKDGNETKIFGIQTTGEIKKGLPNAIKYGFQKFSSTIGQMWLTVVNLFTGGLSINALSGPVGIYTVVGESRKAGIYSVLYLIAYLSINLGLMNILPIPALDGGHVLFLVIEKIRGKKIDAKIENTATMIFFALLIALMIYVSIHDVIRIFT